MAVSVASTAASVRWNPPWSSALALGKCRAYFVNVDFSGTYDGAGGFPASLILSLVGLKFADQILPIGHRAQDPGLGTKPVSFRYVRSTGKLTMHKEGATGHVEYTAGENCGNADNQFLILAET